MKRIIVYASVFTLLLLTACGQQAPAAASPKTEEPKTTEAITPVESMAVSEDTGLGEDDADDVDIGLNIVPEKLGDAMFMEDGFAYPDGSWWVRYYAPDEGVHFDAYRLSAPVYDQATLEQWLAWNAPAAHDITMRAWTLSDPAYPAYELEYYVGGNEDTVAYWGVIVDAPHASFCFTADTGADWLEENEDMIKGVILSMNESAQGSEDITSGAIPCVIPAELVSDPPDGEISMYDGILRVKQFMALQSFEGFVTNDVLLFTYTGIVELNGRECYAVTFSGDGFATRDFAVDGDGLIYEIEPDGRFAPITWY